MAQAPSGPLVYDWNTAGKGYPHRATPVELLSADRAKTVFFMTFAS